MTRSLVVLVVTLPLIVAGCSLFSGGDAALNAALDSTSQILRRSDAREGVVSLHVEPNEPRVWWLLDAPGEDGIVGEYIYVSYLSRGVGSNPIGLDRGQLAASQILRVKRVGKRVLFELPNLKFRATSERAVERRAVEQSFASSVIWATDAKVMDDGRALIDLTPFVVRDAHGVERKLAASNEGSFSLDAKRSVLLPKSILAFPDNVELEAMLTFKGSKPGGEVRSTTPDARSLTVHVHHSIVRLPDGDYRPRPFDPRSGAFSVNFRDYSAPLDASIDRRFATRHRLQKTDPNAASSPVREPIVYYVDPGVPEPVRAALIEGASWWADAFQAAGFENAYRVEVLPEDAHPLDVRYNVIQWVHRETRGWSYGASVRDPRTGEILKGHVSLGSLRIRQDRLLFEGLAGVENTGTGRPDDPIEIALARIRQLSAHEVGHTLGLAHNFAASTYGRASVMDYPAPRVRAVPDGSLDFSNAYSVGVGTWDKHAIRALYAEFDPANEAEELDRIHREARDNGWIYITDADSRGAGSAHPKSHLWDNGEDPIAELTEVLAVRQTALQNFGLRNLGAGEPVTLLHELFVPVYLYHRYQAEAVAKLIGGVDYQYDMNDAAASPPRPVAESRQLAAWSALRSMLDPAFLDVPDNVADVLVPRAPGFGRNRELFGSTTGVTFDRLSAAATAASFLVDLLLEPSRLQRVAEQRAQGINAPKPISELAALCASPRRDLRATSTRRQLVIRAVVARVIADRVLDLSASETVPPLVRASASSALERLRTSTRQSLRRSGDADRLHAQIFEDIESHFEGRPRPDGRWHRPLDVPPGSPIGLPAVHLMGCGCGAR